MQFIDICIQSTLRLEEIPRLCELLKTQTKNNVDGELELNFGFLRIFMFYGFGHNPIMKVEIDDEAGDLLYHRIDIALRFIRQFPEPLPIQMKIHYTHVNFTLYYDNDSRYSYLHITPGQNLHESRFNEILQELLACGLLPKVQSCPRFQHYLNGVDYDNEEVEIYSPSILFKDVIEDGDYIYLDQMPNVETIVNKSRKKDMRR